MTRALALLATLALAACASSAPKPPVAQADQDPICVVPVDGSPVVCPHAREKPGEDTEPCVERVTDTFTHGAGARVYAFCTPAESLKRAEKR